MVLHRQTKTQRRRFQKTYTNPLKQKKNKMFLLLLLLLLLLSSRSEYNQKHHQYYYQAFLGDLVAGEAFSAAEDFLGRRTGLMFGRTPPLAIVTPCSNFPNSSSFLIAKQRCLGFILFFLLSLAAFPASSRT